MPVSGLVLTFDHSFGSPDFVAEQLRALAEVELGAAQGNKLAIVVDSHCRRRDQEIWELLRELPGITDVQVAFVGFDDEPDAPPSFGQDLP